MTDISAGLRAARLKRCRKCDQTKPITEFYPHAGYADGLDNRCRGCLNSTPKSEELKLSTRLRSRAHNRAMAKLKELHPDEYTRLVADALVEVRRESEMLGSTARLKTGPARQGESVLDRIRELCADCGTSHETGHACPYCGATPDHGPTKSVLPRRAPPVDGEARRRRIAALNAEIMRGRATGSSA
jgi:hypothetical protein